MRLVNTTTLKAEEFFGDHVPEYAILSHTWGSDEANFQDWLYTQHQNPPRWGWSTNDDEIKQLLALEGYRKIYKAAEESKRLRCEWLWVDTVCIDKSSSAELSEAINSMYSWYEGATVCIAYLSDVSTSSIPECEAADSEFRQSRWFTRGWTLQELIAPDSVSFYSQEWKCIGSRASLVELMVQITTIPAEVLARGWSPFEGKCQGYSIAQKMSWAAKRKTTRVEDQAYSLIGIFEINMPLLYGEGKMAFTRLMEEIIKRTHDQSFLATRSVKVLAPDPTKFQPGPATNTTLLANFQYDAIRNSPFLITNLGLSIHVAVALTLSDSLCLVMLANADLETVWDELWIPITYTETTGTWNRSNFPGTLLRVRPTHLLRTEVKTVHRYIHTSPVPPTTWADVNGQFNHDCRGGILLAFPSAMTKFRLRESFPHTAFSNPEAPVVYLAKQPVKEHIYSAMIGISARDGNEEPVIHLFFAVLYSRTFEPVLTTCRVICTNGPPLGSRLAAMTQQLTAEVTTDWGAHHWMDSVAVVLGPAFTHHSEAAWTRHSVTVWMAQVIPGVGIEQFRHWEEKRGDKWCGKCAVRFV